MSARTLGLLLGSPWASFQCQYIYVAKTFDLVRSTLVPSWAKHNSLHIGGCQLIPWLLYTIILYVHVCVGSASTIL